MASQHPQIGTWYLDGSSDILFEVVAIDEHFGTIEIQYENGNIDEMDNEQWDFHLYKPSIEPEDSMGAYGMDSDDRWDDEIENNPLEQDNNRLELDSFQDFDDLI